MRAFLVVLGLFLAAMLPHAAHAQRCPSGSVNPTVAQLRLCPYPNYNYVTTNNTPVSILTSGCACNGTTDDTVALNSFFAAHAGYTVNVPPNTSILFNSGNVTANNVIIQGSGPGTVQTLGLGVALSSSVILHDAAHTLILTGGSRLLDMSVQRAGVGINPTTAAQLTLRDTTWPSEYSVGVEIPISQGGEFIERSYIAGFHFGILQFPGAVVIRDSLFDDATGIFLVDGGDYSYYEFDKAFAAMCVASSACSSTSGAWANPSTAFYFMSSPVYSDHLACEFYADCFMFGGQGAGTKVTNSLGEFSQNLFAPVSSNPPYNGFGADGWRWINGQYDYMASDSAHWFSTNYVVDGESSMDIIAPELSDPSLGPNPGALGNFFLWPGGQVLPNNQITFGGAPTVGSKATVTVTGKAFAPQTIGLGYSAAGSLAAATYFVELTYTGPSTETTAGTELFLAVPASNVLTIASPAPWPGATGYNVYISTSSGAETKQNSSPISLGTGWTEPASGLISGASPPLTNTTSWTTSDSYTVGSVPALTDTTTTVAQFLEYALNTDPILIGNHVVADANGSNILYLSIARQMPAPTFSTTVTGGLTANIGEGTPNEVNASSGTIYGGGQLDVNSKYPLIFSFPGTSSGATWLISNIKSPSLLTFPYPNWLSGLDQQNITFSGMFWGLLGGNGPGGITGTACSNGIITNHNDRFSVIENAGSTGCTVTFGVPFPVTPICMVQAGSSSAVALNPGVGTTTVNGFSWTNPSAAGEVVIQGICREP